ncbi:hypothetical protein PSPO01_16347 [Paraphaeosphaeria sporulosa]
MLRYGPPHQDLFPPSPPTARPSKSTLDTKEIPTSSIRNHLIFCKFVFRGLRRLLLPMSTPPSSSQEEPDDVPHLSRGAIVKHSYGAEFHITSIMTCPPRDLYKAALPIFEGQTEFGFDTSCKTTLSCLKCFPQSALLSIRSIHLRHALMSADDCDNRDYAKELGRFIVENMALESITLVVPDDMNAGTDGKDNGQYEWFMWTLHTAAIEAFKQGQFLEVRFAHPKQYYGKPNVFSFHNIENHIEQMLLGSCQALSDRRSSYWESYYRSHDEGVPCQDTPVAVYELVYTIWKAAGYTIDYDDCCMGEEGTVLVLRRVIKSVKRVAEECDQEAKRMKNR